MPSISREKLLAHLEEIRKNVDQPFVGVCDWDNLCNWLAVALCEHEWETKGNPDTPDGPADYAVACKKCGAEADG